MTRRRRDSYLERAAARDAATVDVFHRGMAQLGADIGATVTMDVESAAAGETCMHGPAARDPGEPGQVHAPTAAVLVVPAVAGDAVHFPGEPRDEVSVACHHAGSGAYICLTHQQRCANEYQLDCHLEAFGLGSQHVVARVCRIHGPEAL